MRDAFFRALMIGSVLALATAATDPFHWQKLSSKTGDLPAPGPSEQQTGTIIGDFDHDGVADFMITARKQAPAILWYRRTRSGWEKYVVEDSVLAIEAGGTAADVDGDGDLDILAGGDYSNTDVWWWENPYPKLSANTPWKRRTIKSEGKGQHHDLLTGDFDGDTKLDLVFWNQGAHKLYFAPVPRNPRSAGTWQYREIFDSGGMAEGLATADIDGDGLADIVGGGRWFKHNSDGTFTPNVIDASQPFTRAAAGQLKKAGAPRSCSSRAIGLDG